jgi:cytochrome c-type biogenesis protein CcmH
MKNFFIIFILIYCINPLILKAIEPEEILSNSAFENRARNLSKGIRCLVCQNQTIDDSDSELAKDLRSIIRKKIVQGDTDDEINKFLVDRYGNFILMKPPINKKTMVLWLSPLVLALLGIVIIYFSFRKKNNGFK